jgi:hypothetical protein
MPTKRIARAFETVPLEQIQDLIQVEFPPVGSKKDPKLNAGRIVGVLLVDYEAKLGALRARVMMISGFDVTLAGSRTAAVKKLQSTEPEIFLLSSSVPEEDCEELIAISRQHSPATHVAMLAHGFTVPCRTIADSVLTFTDPKTMVASLSEITLRRQHRSPQPASATKALTPAPTI